MSLDIYKYFIILICSGVLIEHPYDNQLNRSAETNNTHAQYNTINNEQNVYSLTKTQMAFWFISTIILVLLVPTGIYIYMSSIY